MDKRKFFGVFILFIFTIFGGWVSHKFASVNRTVAGKEQLAVMESINENALAKPIQDIVFTRDLYCPMPGYQQVPIGIFGGLQVGCSCRDGRTFLDKCPTGADCAPNQAVSPLDVMYWGSKMRVCIRRSSDVRYLTVKGNDFAGDCPGGYKKCNKFTCVPEKNECPIANVAIVKEGTPLPAGYTQVAAQRSTYYVGLDDRTRYIVGVQRGSAGDDVNLINNITTSVAGNPCYSPLEHPRRLIKTAFVNEITKREGCLSLGEDSKYSTVIDAQAEFDTYNANGITAKLSTMFNEALIKSNDRIFLYGRRQVPMVDMGSCQRYSIGKLQTLQNLIDSGYNYLYWTYLIFGFLIALSIIFYIILLCFRDRAGSKLIGGTVTICFTFASVVLIIQWWLFRERSSNGQHIITTYLNLCQPYDAGSYQNIASGTYTQAQTVLNEMSTLSLISLLVGIGTLFTHALFFYNISKVQRSGDENFVQTQSLTNPVGYQ
jgi:hypothetical protein